MERLPHLAWIASLCAILGWLHFCLGVGPVDLVVTVVAHIAVLPMLSKGFDARLLPSFASALCGMCVGFNLVDMCFDMLIVKDEAVSDGTGRSGLGSLTARHVAWFYYHTMLNSSHINFTLLVYVLVSSIGSMMGLMDGSAAERKLWQKMCCVAAVGNTFYILYVVPRYVSIRASTAFVRADFDNWNGVLFARVFLVGALAACIHLSFLLNLVQSTPARPGKGMAAAKRATA